uniref:Pyrokinin-1 n=1 Tax=Periplaneta americana TaxID=6978 RepID=PPK1_PERAM|nr:RecName: Full=Pyrokinin-1; Short=Pea-PK-1; AltName: Full=FXPRL-amide [Periplaneta americana]
HTAGFIPRL